MKSTIYKLICVVIIGVVYSKPAYEENKSTKCGYESCHPVKEGFINIHLVPHTHDDVGWLKTFDQYYFGGAQYITKNAVQYILDTSIESLMRNKNRRFIYVETAFFWKWWLEQNEEMRQDVVNLVNNGQLEFIGGGWSMNDEATTHYQSTIDQMTWGLRRLNDTFGSCGRPKIGWQIDPFGHSREMASIFAQLGYDAFFMGRIDYDEKIFRQETKTAEMIWKASPNLGYTSDIFTSVLFNGYDAPSGFNFEDLDIFAPIIDDPESPLYNADLRVNEFFMQLQRYSSPYATNNVLITMGSDFSYQTAHTWFKNMDKLIHHANLRQEEGSKYNILYSTPSCYAKAVSDEAAKRNITFRTKEDDFFPYASNLHEYWTGYFTSRPTLKRFERQGNNFLQVCKQLAAITESKQENKLTTLREAMGVLQHHDAITGTEKQAVAYDYANLLHRGIVECSNLTSEALNKLVRRSEDTFPAINFTSCLLTNVSQCAPIENLTSFVVTVYNPLSRSVNKFVRLPVNGNSYHVVDPNGDYITSDLIPIPETVLNIPGRYSSAINELIFKAEDIPPLGFKSYYIKQQSGTDVLQSDPELLFDADDDVLFEMNQDTGFLENISMNGATVSVNQEFLFYYGESGNSFGGQGNSGAYVFRPQGIVANITPSAEFATVTNIYNGELVHEVHQTYNSWTSQIIRVYKNEGFVEFDWIVGPILAEEGKGKEVITRFQTDLNTNGTFYTDSNGRELLKRVRDQRPTWNLKLYEAVAGNYYPVTSKIVLKDPESNVQFAVLTDRAQGGSSLNDGQVELMVHRRCMFDDGYGVGEPLAEMAFSKYLVVRGSHYVVLGLMDDNGSGKSMSAIERDIEQKKLLDSWIYVSPTYGNTVDEYITKYETQFSGLRNSLPGNVHILTLEPWRENHLLLRLEHTMEKDYDVNLSQPVTINLKDLLSLFTITSIKETTLGGNQWLEEKSRLNFTAGGSLEEMLNRTSSYYNKSKAFEENNFIFDSTLQDEEGIHVTLAPMQIRTFIIEIERR